MATSPLTWKEIEGLRDTADALADVAGESASLADSSLLLERAAMLREIAEKFDYGYVAGKPRDLHPNPACFHCGRRDWDTVEKLAAHYVRRHGYVNEKEAWDREVSYDVVAQNAAASVFRRAGIRKDTR